MASPTDLQIDTAPPSFINAEGKWEHRYRQSWFKTLSMCQEQARADRAGELPDHETDAANLGTSVHDAIEMCLQDVMTYGQPMALADMHEVFNESFGTAMQLPSFRFVKSTEATSRKHGMMCIDAWYAQVLPTAAPVGIEIPFNVVLFEDEHRVVRVKGTIDVLDANLGARDWKTSGQAYSKDAWKYERFDVQSTIYTFALRELGMLEEAESYPFGFVVMIKGRVGHEAIDELTVTRTPRHWEFLKRKALTASLLIEAELPQWPLSDSDWFCNPKWCPKYATCRGDLLAQ